MADKQSKLDELFNKTINAKQIAVDTVTENMDLFDNTEIAAEANKLLDRYRGEYKAEIKALFKELIGKDREYNDRDLPEVIEQIKTENRRNAELREAVEGL